MAGLSMSACRCSGGTAGGTNSVPIAVGGPRVLLYDGEVYEILTTYYLDLPEGLQYTMEYAAPAKIVVDGITDAEAYRVTRPLMRGAWEQGWHAQTRITQVGAGARRVDRIGVVLYPNGTRTRGYRVARSLASIAAEVRSSGGSSTGSSEPPEQRTP